MNTDTDRIEALEALVHRIIPKDTLASSDLYISGRWGERSFMLCLRNEHLGDNEKVLFASSLRELVDKLIDYERYTTASIG